LLAGVVQKATGVSVHDYLKSRLFQPLGITSDTWISDTAGNNFGMSHLTINAKDLTKVGLLLINRGRWNHIPLINEEWIDLMIQPSQEFNPFYGLLCWLSYCHLDIYWSQDLLDFYAGEGVNPYYLRCLASLCGRVLSFNGDVSYGSFLEDVSIQLAGTFGSCQDVRNFFNEIESKGLPLGKFKVGKLKSFSARGYQGQKLLVIPDEGVIAVRLAKTCGTFDDGQADIFADLESSLENAVKECGTCDQAPPSEVVSESFEEPSADTSWEDKTKSQFYDNVNRGIKKVKSSSKKRKIVF
jgi:CubicO group peptidase (beta-lactamase class C family)